jgi:hypothetical protein
VERFKSLHLKENGPEEKHQREINNFSVRELFSKENVARSTDTNRKLTIKTRNFLQLSVCYFEWKIPHNIPHKYSSEPE